MHEEAQREESKRKERELREKEKALMAAGRVGDLTDERRTSNIEHRTSNEDGEIMTAQEYLAMVGKTSLLEK